MASTRLSTEITPSSSISVFLSSNSEMTAEWRCEVNPRHMYNNEEWTSDTKAQGISAWLCLMECSNSSSVNVERLRGFLRVKIRSREVSDMRHIPKSVEEVPSHQERLKD